MRVPREALHDRARHVAWEPILESFALLADVLLPHRDFSDSSSVKTYNLIASMSSMRCPQLLGGRVDELYEAWDFQKKFGGSARPAAAADPAAELDRPPQFKTFVPGKTRVPKRPPPADASANGHRCFQALRLLPSGCLLQDCMADTVYEIILGLMHELPDGVCWCVSLIVVHAALA